MLIGVYGTNEGLENTPDSFWATPCERGCSIRANYHSTTVHLSPALATGKLDVVTDAMAREVFLGDKGLARGVRFIDKRTGKDCWRR